MYLCILTARSPVYIPRYCFYSIPIHLCCTIAEEEIGLVCDSKSCCLTEFIVFKGSLSVEFGWGLGASIFALGCSFGCCNGLVSPILIGLVITGGGSIMGFGISTITGFSCGGLINLVVGSDLKVLTCCVSRVPV
jgi:hypothetical protein